MTPFAAKLSILCLRYADAAELLTNSGRRLQESTVKDIARGKSRVPAALDEQLTALFEAVENAVDKILSDQGEVGMAPLKVDIDAIDLPHERLRLAAFARAQLLMGSDLIRVR